SFTFRAQIRLGASRHCRHRLEGRQGQGRDRPSRPNARHLASRQRDARLADFFRARPRTLQMTQIDFFTHVAQPLKLAARLISQAYRTHRRLRVLAPDAETAHALDRLLWLDPPLSFLPHCRMDSAIASETPIWIDERPGHKGRAGGLANLP